MDEHILAIRQYQADLAKIVKFYGSRSCALSELRDKAKALRCSVKAAASILVAQLESEIPAQVSALDREDLQAQEKHENDR